MTAPLHGWIRLRRSVGIREIHSLRRRMDFDHSRARLMAADQFFNRISPVRIDHRAGDHRFGVPSNYREDIIVQNIK